MDPTAFVSVTGALLNLVGSAADLVVAVVAHAVVPLHYGCPATLGAIEDGEFLSIGVVEDSS